MTSLVSRQELMEQLESSNDGPHADAASAHDESLAHPNHFTPIQSKRFRRPIRCWSLCPSMDLVALGTGGNDVKNTSGSPLKRRGGERLLVNDVDGLTVAETVAVHRIVSWQRLLSLGLDKLTSVYQDDLEGDFGGQDEDIDWDLAEDGCGPLFPKSDEWIVPASIHDPGDQSEEKTEHNKTRGSTSVCWSPDGRCVAIGLYDGGVLLHNVEPDASKADDPAVDDGAMNQRPMHVIRTSHQIVSPLLSNDNLNDARDENQKRLIAFSPRVTRSMAAKKERLKGDNDMCSSGTKSIKCDASSKPKVKTQDSHSSAVIGLAWKCTSSYHSSWELSDSEWESRESWRHLSQFIDRGKQFLPAESYADENYSTGAKGLGQINMFSPLAHLNVLWVATRRELHWFLQSQYRILTNSLDFSLGFSMTSVDVISSPNMSSVLCVAQGESRDVSREKVFSPEVKIFSCPLLESKRFDLQILAAAHRSIFSRMRSVKQGIESAVNSWVSALRPLDAKFQRLFQLFRNYHVTKSEFEVGSASSSIREELLRFILSGRSTVVGDASNALDQFFTRPDMHDQLLIKEANGIKASVGSIEAKLSSSVQSQIRAIVYEIEELYGLVRAQEYTVTDSILIDPDMALRLYSSSRILFLTFERFIAHVVEARSRLNDFLAWIRGTATEIRARGTAADSIQRQHARDRRCPHGVVCRITDILSKPILSPCHGVADIKLDHRKLTECIIGVPLSDSLAAYSIPSKKEKDFPDGGGTVKSALLQTFEIAAALFDQPRSVCSRSLCAMDMTFEVRHSIIALHTRIGVGSESQSCDGYFSPRINGDLSLLLCPYWVLVVRTIALTPGADALEINAIPSYVLDTAIEANDRPSSSNAPLVCLQAHLRIPNGCEVASLAFYSGNNSLSPNLDIDVGLKEEKQSLGLIMKQKRDNSVIEELWKIQYDNVLFEVCDLKVTSHEIRVATSINRDSFSTLSPTQADDDNIHSKKRLICTRDSSIESQTSQLGLCGSRGTGGVLTFGPLSALEIFDLEEDEDADDEGDEESCQVEEED